MRTIFWTVMVVVIQFGWVAGAWADDAASPDEAAVRASGKAFLEAYNAGDAAALAALWSPQAVYMDPATGEATVGRDAIEEQFAAAFADKSGARLTVDVDSIEFVSPNVAIQRGAAHVLRAGDEPTDSNFTAVLVQRDGKWLLDRVSETEAAELPQSHYEHLKDLEWMIGSWVDNGDPGITIHTDCAWTKSKNFMTRSFAVAVGDEVDMAGMQVVGWDPAAKQIRSWVFDSDGGFGEGRWTRKGKQWFIQATGTLPDGGQSTAVHIITEIDANSFSWQSINRQVDGVLQPNIDEALVVRKPVD